MALEKIALKNSVLQQIARPIARFAEWDRRLKIMVARNKSHNRVAAIVISRVCDASFCSVKVAMAG
ncbi:hypothetical protein [Pelagibaculum spongiae]|uniref:Uncharacterized protein n=1 Tax=Pelagibaculum spongiae TaxID=2080658 RepID=A0A2V1GYW0_9GAMM|nr:hypothetical protein [Pelagibaculum spongiae]PVZ71946.1 hypothetical protein DC094_02680 [Pelagibaculum spongiae]